MKRRSSGFTLIELLVVIAIIGILASVIMAALNDARQQSINTKIRTEMDSIAKRAAIEQVGSKTYNTVCGTNGFSTSTVIVGIIASIENFASSSIACNSSVDEYAVSVPVDTVYWCIDSTGNKMEVPDALTAGELVCS